MSKCTQRIYQFFYKIGMRFLPWRIPTIFKGENATRRAVIAAKNKGHQHIFVVLDKGVLNNKLADGLFNAVKEYGMNCYVFDKVIPNPTIDIVEEGVKCFWKSDCTCIFAIGGGSPIDVAKLIGARVACQKKSVQQMRGQLKIRKHLPFFVAIPTTAGTGSEATLAAVVTDASTHEKYAVNDPVLIPDYAVLDPTLLVSLPQNLTATTGMDALTHAIEAYIGRSNTKQTRKAAERATKLLLENLEKSYLDGSDLGARERVQEGAFFAGVAFTRAFVGNVHAIAHALSAKYNTPHGFANAVILPVVLKYYGTAINKSVAKLCDECGLFQDLITKQQKTSAFISKIEELNAKFNIPKTIDAIKSEDLDALVEHAFKEANPLYPVPVIFDKKDFENVIKMIMSE